MNDGTSTTDGTAMFTVQLRGLREDGISIARRARELEKLVARVVIAGSVDDGAARPTTAILRLLRGGPRTKNEIVTILADVIDSKATDRRRSLYATIGHMRRRGVVREEEGHLMSLA